MLFLITFLNIVYEKKAKPVIAIIGSVFIDTFLVITQKYRLIPRLYVFSVRFFKLMDINNSRIFSYDNNIIKPTKITWLGH